MVKAPHSGRGRRPTISILRPQLEVEAAEVEAAVAEAAVAVATQVTAAVKAAATAADAVMEAETKKRKRVESLAEEARRILAAADLFEVLLVQRTATTEEIKKAYKRLAPRVHPDQNTADEAKEAFLQLQLALETLSDTTELNKYRLTIAKWLTSVRDVLNRMSLATYADEFDRRGYNDVTVPSRISLCASCGDVALPSCLAVLGSHAWSRWRSR